MKLNASNIRLLGEHLLPKSNIISSPNNGRRKCSAAATRHTCKLILTKKFMAQFSKALDFRPNELTEIFSSKSSLCYHLHGRVVLLIPFLDRFDGRSAWRGPAMYVFMMAVNGDAGKRIFLAASMLVPHSQQKQPNHNDQ